MSRQDFLASPDDGKDILRVLESSPAKGSIELLYTRRPDAYLSYKKESKDVDVLAVKKDGNVVGTCAEIIRDVYVGGASVRAAYVCGLKKDSAYDGNVGWGKLFIGSLVREDVDCYFCSVVEDNIEAQKMFERKGSHFLDMNCLCEYTTYILKPYFKFKGGKRDYIFRQAESGDEGRILDFLRREGKKKDLFPVIESLDSFSDLFVTDFYFLECDGEILATAALWDQTGYRQYLVKKYNGIMKYARAFNSVLYLFGYMKLPKENENLNFPMLSFFLSKDDNEEYYKTFLNYICKEVKKKYDIFVIGTPRNSFANNIYKKLRSVHFDTKIYSVRFILGNGKTLNIDKDRIFLECGLL